MDLGQLFNHYGSDKDFVGYTSLYHTLFHHRTREKLNLLEIGIGTMLSNVHSSMREFALPGYKPGGSLRAWRDYFVAASIHGIDVQPDTQFSEDRITTFLCDSTDERQVTSLFETLNGLKFDIIVDDASHIDTNQLKTLELFYPHLISGGIYVIEDLNPEAIMVKQPEILEPLCNHDPYFFVGIENNMCAIFKNHLTRETLPYHY
jgi:hypothetical protein